MPATRPPFVKAVLDAVVPATARWLVSKMRRLEEANMDAAARWELLRRSLEQLGKEQGR
jgi:hypothetical protein